jgi:hypothetical protein
MQFQGSTFAHSDVEVDGNRYERCTFKHCTFVYQGGPLPQFSHCSFEGTFCRLTDAAENNPMFMTALFHGGFHTDVERAFTNRRADRPLRENRFAQISTFIEDRTCMSRLSCLPGDQETCPSFCRQR